MTLATWLLFSGCGGPDADLPAHYRHLTVPAELLASRVARERGRALFLRHCAICHGVHADGRGIRSEGLDPAPMDFTNPEFSKSVSPRRVFYWIRNGVPGTAMPAWKIFSDRETWELAAYVLSVGKAQR
jgi:mono/diheme cytochrome c family protein